VVFKTLSDISREKGDSRSFLPSNDYAIPNNKVGIELEIESPPTLTALVRQGLWTQIGDNSLRTVNGREGKELITSPIFGEDINTALAQLAPVFASNTAVFSGRTSVHVHVEVVDLDKEALVKLLLLYTSLERRE